MTKAQLLLVVQLLIFVLAGCSVNQEDIAPKNNQTNLSVSRNQNIDNTIDSGEHSKSSQPNSMIENGISNLELTLPKGWNLNTENQFGTSLADENGINLGSVVTYPYTDDFSFNMYKPNHSEITHEEEIDTSIGSGKLYTLDADNGTAASGLTGTHDVYFAVIPIQDKIIFVLEFTKHDKEASTKKQFISLLDGLRLKK
ncbi:hypothetical protein BK120_27085 [Paenibacillus sp. FSL A5-0031]|uniref:hypothetical protein n=1 Tax=Paenibacillus sp. FSL A5-0031 TaxID=1920420 RepID=UPI00096FD2C9|nr:hypothetical protein [Paenibacillus sp. FSL A5-0031]OME77194.1 hypothetical protein BK120_27085 [Paenibacillus sp. FSL A5-0031]